MLDAHYAKQLAVALVPPEHNSGGDLAVELVRRHVGLVPAIGRDHAAIGLGGGVDDCEDRLTLIISAAADGRHGRKSRRHAILVRWPSSPPRGTSCELGTWRTRGTSSR